MHLIFQVLFENSPYFIYYLCPSFANIPCAAIPVIHDYTAKQTSHEGKNNSSYAGINALLIKLLKFFITFKNEAAF